MSSPTEERPGAIHARPVPHPGRWVAIAILVLLFGMMIHSFVTNPRWEWSWVGTIMTYSPVLQGLVQGTIVGTVVAMIIGVVLGVAVAVMRLSNNPVLKYVSATYTWFFRSIPRYVLLVILGMGLGYLYPVLSIGVPFGHQIAKLFGSTSDLAFGHIVMRNVSNSIWIGAVGLGLSEAAYMAEIARAGIVSVDKGQREAAQALGMSERQTMQRIVLPQAMRVIVPPTGNETVAMVKDTSLLVAIPITMELFNQTMIVANRTYHIMPALVAATLWYIIVCSVLMVGQYYLERYFGRGFGDNVNPQAKRLLSKVAEH